MGESWRQERSPRSDTFMGRSCCAPQLNGGRGRAGDSCKSSWADSVPSREAEPVGGGQEFHFRCAWKGQVGSELSLSGAGRKGLGLRCNWEAFSTLAVTLSCGSHCGHLGKEYGRRAQMGLRGVPTGGLIEGFLNENYYMRRRDLKVQ